MEERPLKTKDPSPSRYGKYSIALAPTVFTGCQQSRIFSITYKEETTFIDWALSLLFVD